MTKPIQLENIISATLGAAEHHFDTFLVRPVRNHLISGGDEVDYIEVIEGDMEDYPDDEEWTSDVYYQVCGISSNSKCEEPTPIFTRETAEDAIRTLRRMGVISCAS